MRQRQDEGGGMNESDLREWLTAQATAHDEVGNDYAGQGDDRVAASLFGRAAAYRAVLAWLDHEAAKEAA
jgi:hypothetical protein